jgi:hypothetical protein
MKRLKTFGIVLLFIVLGCGGLFLLSSSPAGSSTETAVTCLDGGVFSKDNIASLGEYKLARVDDRVLLINDAYYVVVPQGTTRYAPTAGQCFFFTKEAAQAYVRQVPASGGSVSMIAYILLFILVNGGFVWLSMTTGRLSRFVVAKEYGIEFVISRSDPDEKVLARHYTGEGTVRGTISLRLKDPTNPTFLLSFRNPAHLEGVFRQVVAVMKREVQIVATDLWLDEYALILKDPSLKALDDSSDILELEESFGYAITVQLMQPELNPGTREKLEAAQESILDAVQVRDQIATAGVSDIGWAFINMIPGLNRLANAASVFAAAKSEEVAQGNRSKESED